MGGRSGSILLATSPCGGARKRSSTPGGGNRRRRSEDGARLAGCDVKSAERILIEVPVRVLRLTAAALFERNAHGDFEPKSRFRWPEGVLNILGNETPLRTMARPRRLLN